MPTGLLSSAEFFQKGVSFDPGQSPDMGSNCLLLNVINRRHSSGELCLIRVDMNEYKMQRYKIVHFLHDNAQITWVKFKIC